MSSIFNNPLRVSTTNLRNRFHQQPSSSSPQDETHYQHGIPGIPTDGKVVLLKNSNNGAQVYLLGTVRISKQSAETVKKVIDYVKPDVVAVELCKGRAEKLMNWKPVDDTLCNLFRKSMRAPGELCRKIDIFIENCWYHRLHANGIFPGLEFKVAMEESSRVGASCFYIDQDVDVTDQQLSKHLSFFYLLGKAFATPLLSYADFIVEKCTRAFVREINSFLKKRVPKMFKAMTEDRDRFMFTNLRSFQGKVIAVVGFGHMDGIELLWKRAEEDDNSSICITIGT